MKQHLSIYLVALSILLSACGQLDGDVLSFRSADPRLTIGFRLLPAPPVTIEPQVVPPTATPTEEVIVELPTVTPTPCRTIAGNINAQGQKLWHDESSPQWSQIRIDESKGERWFCDAASAEAAGWTKAGGN